MREDLNAEARIMPQELYNHRHPDPVVAPQWSLAPFEGVYTAAAGALSALSGVRSVIVRQANEIADLNSQLIVERQTRVNRSKVVSVSGQRFREDFSSTKCRRPMGAFSIC